MVSTEVGDRSGSPCAVNFFYFLKILRLGPGTRNEKLRPFLNNFKLVKFTIFTESLELGEVS